MDTVAKKHALLASVFALLLLQGCGNFSGCFYSNLGVTGSAESADHTSVPPGNTIVFLAFGSGTNTGCFSTQSNLTNVTWSVSDTENVRISNAKDQTYGVATCLQSTSGPVTVTATLPSDLNNGVTASGISTMSCR
ncbi:MAG: hypothetical protein ACXVZX_04150 [Terriglobales bacterium]